MNYFEGSNSKHKLKARLCTQTEKSSFKLKHYSRDIHFPPANMTDVTPCYSSAEGPYKLISIKIDKWKD